MTIKDKIISEIKLLPQNRVKEVFDFIEFLKMREEWQATNEILADKKLMKSIKKGLDDIKAGRVKGWERI